MQPRPSFDRTILIPIAIGVVSILGIGWILLTSVLSQSLSTPTAIPSGFRSLATRTPTSTASPTPTETSPVSYPGPLTETLPVTITLVTESPPPPSATPTPAGIQPLSAGKYDDTDPDIAYDQYWTALQNVSTENAYHGTLHVSTGIGEAAFFRFTGKGFRLGYQRVPIPAARAR